MHYIDKSTIMLPSLLSNLRLPIIVAPMFLASGTELVVSACRSGIIGTFPAANARTAEILLKWIDDIETALDTQAPCYGVNLVLAPRPGGDALRNACIDRRVPLLITSNGDPSEITALAHGWGGKVLHDVTTLRHAEKAAAAGVDGLILVCAGAGGHAGTLNPFTFLPEIRRFFDGLIILAGSISDGAGVLAAQALGADLVYMGTRFLAAEEAMISDRQKHMMLAAGSADILLTDAISGLPANFMRPSIVTAGLDPAALPRPHAPQKPDLPNDVAAWRDIWSAGQGVTHIHSVQPVAAIVSEIERQYAEARFALAQDTRFPSSAKAIRS